MHSISKKEVKLNQSGCYVMLYTLTFEKPILISGVDGVISIELNID